jgi:uncharacterized membrane protein
MLYYNKFIKTFLLSYFSVLIAMLAFDGPWLAPMGKRFYFPRVGHVLAASPKLVSGGVFYSLYILGLVVLVVAPAVRSDAGFGRTFLLGALLGLVAYGTYDLTNQATLTGHR